MFVIPIRRLSRGKGIQRPGPRGQLLQEGGQQGALLRGVVQVQGHQRQVGGAQDTGGQGRPRESAGNRSVRR